MSTLQIRLLPNIKGQKFFHPQRLHRIGEFECFCGKDYNFEEKKWFGGCYICNFIKKHIHKNEVTGDLTVKEVPSFYSGKNFSEDLRSIHPFTIYYCNVIVRNVKNDCLLVKNFNYVLFKQIVYGIIGDPKCEISILGDITNPYTGRDFICNEKNNTINFLPVSKLGTEDQVNFLLGKLNDLTKMKILDSKSKIQKLLYDFFGTSCYNNEYKSALAPWNPSF